MTRRAYGFAVGLAVSIGVLAWIASYRLDLPLRDPDGFIGPAYVRLPAIVLMFFLADVVPRVLISNRGFRNFWPSFKLYSVQRWTRGRIALVLVGLSSFYVVYVAYRNLKGFLPFVREDLHDALLLKLDRALAFGHDPAAVLHSLLGTGFTAHFLSFVYISYLMFVPLSLGAALIWSKNVSTGYWYVIALCVNWILGVASYYWLPSQGPYFAKHSLFNDLPDTGVTKLQDALATGRDNVLSDPYASDSVQSIAAFASLHVSVIFTAALIAHYVISSRSVRWFMWVYFAWTATATIYFGWHYLLDDVAGLAIGWIAVWIGAAVTGHKMRVQRREPDPGDGVIGVFPPDVARTESDVDASANGARRPREEAPADSTVPSGSRPDDRDSTGR